MSVSNDLRHGPFILIFSPHAKLVSFSNNLRNELTEGLVFDSLFNINIFHDILQEKDSLPSAINFRIFQTDYKYAFHSLKDPDNNILALIITLIAPIESPANVDIDEKMIRMDRLAQIGQLAASIAHEIRNPLAGINANVQVLYDMLKKENSFGKFFDVILEEIMRIEKILKDLLNYAKHSRPAFENISVEKIYDHVYTLISAQLNKKNVKIKFNKDGEIPVINGDFGQLIQVFLNCIFNSVEAMPDGGEIIINVRNHENADAIEISFIDTGIGIPKEIIEKIFNPFFTTRAKGLGLGLTVVKKIIDDHHGKISVKSIEGEGTEIALSFPKI